MNNRRSSRLRRLSPHTTVAGDLLRSANAKTNGLPAGVHVVAKESLVRTAVNASVEVDLSAVLVRAAGRLRAERVAVGRAKVGDHDGDGVARVGDFVAAAVGLDGESPAGTAAWTSACTLSRY